MRAGLTVSCDYNLQVMPQTDTVNSKKDRKRRKKIAVRIPRFTLLRSTSNLFAELCSVLTLLMLQLVYRSASRQTGCVQLLLITLILRLLASGTVFPCYWRIQSHLDHVFWQNACITVMPLMRISVCTISLRDKTVLLITWNITMTGFRCSLLRSTIL